MVNHDYVEDLLDTQILVNEIGKSLLFFYEKTEKKGSNELFKIEAYLRKKLILTNFPNI